MQRPMIIFGTINKRKKNREERKEKKVAKAGFELFFIVPKSFTQRPSLKRIIFIVN